MPPFVNLTIIILHFLFSFQGIVKHLFSAHAAVLWLCMHVCSLFRREAPILLPILTSPPTAAAATSKVAAVMLVWCSLLISPPLPTCCHPLTAGQSYCRLMALTADGRHWPKLDNTWKNLIWLWIQTVSIIYGKIIINFLTSECLSLGKENWKKQEHYWIFFLLLNPSLLK